MAERDQLGGALCGHDPGDSRRREHVAFFLTASHRGAERVPVHPDEALRARLPVRRLFVRHIDHARLSALIQVR